MIQTAAPPLAILEAPYRPLWPLAQAWLARGSGVAFLESGGPVGAGSRWSILGWRPARVLCWPPGRPGALPALRELLHERPGVRPLDSPLPFHGGWLGWFAYDLGRQIERLPALLPADPAVPDFALGEYAQVLVEDRQERRLYVAGRGDLAVAARDAFAPACDAAPPAPDAPLTLAPPAPLLSRAAYLDRARRVLAYIRAGDIYQANLAHPFLAETDASAAALYARLRAASPAPYGCAIALPGAPDVLSISPELFLCRSGAAVTTRPIKGTRPRAADPAEDARLRGELRDSPKEQAELLMIVDLLRNDLGRVARIGSVCVDALRELEAHPTVHHAVATIRAELPAPVDAVDLLAATFPGGSVTGAPKIRAMQILEALEPVRRGPYTGAAGYIGYDGDLALNILIRTLVRRGRQVQFHVGGGIVADSDPEAEYEETLTKARALLHALGGGAAGMPG